MLQLWTQHGSLDNHSNPRAQTATNAAIIPRTVSIRELIHALSAPTCPAGRSDFIKSIPAGPRGPHQVVTQRHGIGKVVMKNIDGVRRAGHRSWRIPACFLALVWRCAVRVTGQDKVALMLTSREVHDDGKHCLNFFRGILERPYG